MLPSPFPRSSWLPQAGSLALSLPSPFHISAISGFSKKERRPKSFPADVFEIVGSSLRILAPGAKRGVGFFEENKPRAKPCPIGSNLSSAKTQHSDKSVSLSHVCVILVASLEALIPKNKICIKLYNSYLAQYAVYNQELFANLLQYYRAGEEKLLQREPTLVN